MGPALIAPSPRVSFDALSHCAVSQARGSSPRVRGTGLGRQGRQRHTRFIPARAGNGTISRANMRRRAVHPRACGEQLLSPPPHTPRAGSSPRVRGTVEAGGHLPRFGSSPRVRGRLPERAPHKAISVHPRACGEQFWYPEREGTRPVHPRACGEQSRCRLSPRVRTSSARTFGVTGSSPRVRGTHRPVWKRRFIPARAGTAYHCPVSGSRFIPARAGNRYAASRHRATFTLVIGSSPRVRGTAAIGASAIRSRLGSSPRVRGTVFLHLPDFQSKIKALSIYQPYGDSFTCRGVNQISSAGRF